MRVRDDLALGFGSVKGPVREENEDDYLVFEPEDDDDLERHGRLLAVADGMGGGPGAEASRIALRTFLAAYLDTVGDEPVAERLEGALARACAALAQEAERDRSLLGMGTTLTAVVLKGGRLTGVHVGDSRCLVLQAGRNRWLSELHASGVDEHQLTRVVGGGTATVEPNRFEAELSPGDRLLLMTDGMWRAVPEAELVATVEACAVPEAVSQLLERAQQLDGSDNATLVLATRVAEAAGGDADIEDVDAEVRPSLTRFGARTRGWIAHWPWLLLAIGLGLAAVALVAR